MNPEKIGRYIIKSELGRGGMATVYKAYDPRFEREVALKVLPREMMHDENFRVRFSREAKTIASLEHSAIVPVYDVGEEDDQPYFVMRYMTGGSLADQIEKGPISLREAARLMDRLGPALDQAHSKGVIHRDLKPGNILFDPAGEPYISDFGIAKIAQGQSTSVTGGAIIGTPAYMSPEQAQGDPLDGRSDIYALGVILYEILAGTQPYQATTPMAVVVKHITDPIPHILDANPRLPSGIETIIEKAMAKNPNDRFSTAGEFAAALNALDRGESAEEALKTAVLTVTRNQAAKTRMAGKVDATRASSPKQGGISPLVFAIPIVAVLVIGVIVVAVVIFASRGGFTSQQPTSTTAPVVLAATTAPEQTKTPEPPTATEPVVPVEQPTPTETETPKPAVNVVGGADSVALIADNDVWLINIDGSNPRQLTNDKGAKLGLQWMPDNQTLVYISGKNIYTVDSVSSRVDILMTFPNTQFLDAFQISPDGKQVAISMNHEMFIVPLDLEQLKNAHGRDALIAMKGCISVTPGTAAATVVRKFRWAADGKLISWLFAGRDSGGGQVDEVDIMDISTCDPTKIQRIDEFPGVRFTISKPDISDFDWDGNSLFVFNTIVRNGGWGDLYTYNRELGKGNQLAPIGGKSQCCYRDARWSPDGTYVIFAFQDRNLAEKAPTLIYYLPFGALETGAEFSPIPLPEGLFKENQRQALEFAPHAAQP